MDEEQYRKKTVELLERIAENTRPSGHFKRYLVWVGLILQATGVFVVVQKIFEFFRG